MPHCQPNSENIVHQVTISTLRRYQLKSGEKQSDKNCTAQSATRVVTGIRTHDSATRMQTQTNTKPVSILVADESLRLRPKGVRPP